MADRSAEEHLEHEALPEVQAAPAKRTLPASWWLCPYDESRLVPLGDTPGWFRCQRDQAKHYFRVKTTESGHTWTDVLTETRVKVRAQRFLPETPPEGAEEG